MELFNMLPRPKEISIYRQKVLNHFKKAGYKRELDVLASMPDILAQSNLRCKNVNKSNLFF